MKAAFTAGEAMLRESLERLSLPCPERIPLRADEKAALLVSALPQVLGGMTGENPRELAVRLAKQSLPAYPFDPVQAAGSVVLLPLSRQWMEDVLARWVGEIPPVPPRTGVRLCDRGDQGFLLDYTARRCAALSCQGGGAASLPPALICLLAKEQPDAVAVANAFWALPPVERRNPALARAVGRCAAGFTNNSPCFVPQTI